jgi:hypothetical protein
MTVGIKLLGWRLRSLMTAMAITLVMGVICGFSLVLGLAVLMVRGRARYASSSSVP